MTEKKGVEKRIVGDRPLKLSNNGPSPITNVVRIAGPAKPVVSPPPPKKK